MLVVVVQYLSHFNTGLKPQDGISGAAALRYQGECKRRDTVITVPGFI